VSIRQIPATEFKATCLKILDEVSRHGTEILITKRGKPVARLIGVATSAHATRGAWKGLARIRGDIVHCDWSEDFDVTR
jgi:prevent-host-death family protein